MISSLPEYNDVVRMNERAVGKQITAVQNDVSVSSSPSTTNVVDNPLTVKERSDEHCSSVQVGTGEKVSSDAVYENAIEPESMRTRVGTDAKVEQVTSECCESAGRLSSVQVEEVSKQHTLDDDVSYECKEDEECKYDYPDTLSVRSSSPEPELLKSAEVKHVTFASPVVTDERIMSPEKREDNTITETDNNDKVIIT